MNMGVAEGSAYFRYSENALYSTFPSTTEAAVTIYRHDGKVKYTPTPAFGLMSVQSVQPYAYNTTLIYIYL
jgi:hypothetical protein